MWLTRARHAGTGIDQATRVFRALGCEQRIRLLRLLRKWDGIDPCCDGVLKAFTRASKELQISRSTLSHHFKELETAGLIVCRRNGQAIACKVNEELLGQALAAIRKPD